MDFFLEKQTVVDALNDASRRIAQRIDDLGLTASGKTARSMHVETTPLGAMLLGRAKFYTLEEGASPQDAREEANGDFPTFQAIIAQWIDDKGLDLNAGRVASKIWREGTALYRSGETQDVYTTILDEELERLRQSLRVKVAQTVAQRLAMI